MPPKTNHKKPLTKEDFPFYIINLQRHLERIFDLWTIKKPSLKIQFKRSLIFVSCLVITLFWPVNNLLTNLLILVLAWTILCLTSQPVSRWLLMLNLMLNISWLYFLMKFLLSLTGSEPL